MKGKKAELEKILETFSEFDEKTVIVEGKNDEKALKSLGVNNIIAINGRPLYEVAEIALKSENEIVILTDFDREGREIEHRLRELLQRQGKRPNSRLRGKVMSLGRNKIEDFGKISSSQNLKEDDIHVKIGTNINKVRNKSGNRRSRSNRET
jgi:5S rRNA maturation endonuclease (ribonuclease M5)